MNNFLVTFEFAFHLCVTLQWDTFIYVYNNTSYKMSSYLFPFLTFSKLFYFRKFKDIYVSSFHFRYHFAECISARDRLTCDSIFEILKILQTLKFSALFQKWIQPWYSVEGHPIVVESFKKPQFSKRYISALGKCYQKEKLKILQL